MSIDLGHLVLAPPLVTVCEAAGTGMAACPTLGLLATSDMEGNTLSVFALPARTPGKDTPAQAGLALVCTLGGLESPAPMQFLFRVAEGGSGFLAFAGPPTARVLLATDAGHDAVHIIDVVGQVHAGYVAAPGTIAGPRGVAARGSLVAVSAWTSYYDCDHAIHLFEDHGGRWAPLRSLCAGFGRPGWADGQLSQPYGLRFAADGNTIAVADSNNGRVCVVRVDNGSFVQHAGTELRGPMDVEECEGGWLVACTDSHSVVLVSGGVARGKFRGWGVQFSDSGSDDHDSDVDSEDGDDDPESDAAWYPTNLALVPGLGLAVRDLGTGGWIQVFCIPPSTLESTLTGS
jgi:hypothetical protein